MSTQKTANYQLSQWVKSDRIQMDDFNSDNAKIDTALKALADKDTAMEAALAKCGNCKIVYGTYTGNDKCGSDNPNKLTFIGKPILVIVQAQSNTSMYDQHLRLMRGCSWAVGDHSNSSYKNTVGWGDTYVSWYGSKAATQFNTQSIVYNYIAFLSSEA